MKIIKQGEKADRSVKVSGDVVTRKHVTLNKATSAEYQLEWSFDFAEVTKEELMTLASRSIVIALRPEFKIALSAELPSWEAKTFSVREYLDSERATIPASDKVKRLLDKMSVEQRQAILSQLVKSTEE